MPKITFKPERHWHEQIKLNRFIYTSVLFDMCRENNVKVITNAMLSAVEESHDGVRLIITEKSGLFEIKAKNAIDATGDANLAVLAGYEVEKSQIQQPATLQNHISGYNFQDIDLDEIREKFNTAELPEYINADKLINFLRGNRIDMHVPCVDADTSDGKTELEQRALFTYLKVYKFLRGIKGLGSLTVDFIAAETGVRETNRIVGEATVTAKDYIDGFFYPDSVCYAFYPIDLHVLSGIEKTYHKENVVAKIPYRALIPKASKRILCAGRCISSDTYANSGIRVEAVCMATGQAAGCAAALSAKADCCVGDVKYSELCRH